MIGTKLREFEVIGDLGAGGYGVVYKAHDSSVDREVALKMILPQYANHEEFIQRFDTEARLVAQLEHPFIVPLYSYWHDEHGAFLVMRYIRGGSLRSLLARQGALPITSAMRLLTQISEALDAAHQANVVHRDIKPENILIDTRGNGYLTDFGIAILLDDSADASFGAVIGTLAYLSPEQLQRGPIMPQTDIYAFGILIYECLTGQHPFKDASPTEMIKKHLSEPLPSARTLRADLPMAVDQVLARATAKSLFDRYESAGEVLSALKVALNMSGTVTNRDVSKVSARQRKTAVTAELRNRYAMLQNVHAVWIEGVLEKSLHNALLIDLGKEYDGQAVENPWNTLLRMPNSRVPMPIDQPTIEIFDRLNGKMLILGDPGSGKTTTLLEIARDLLDRAEIDDQHPIPVIFNLSSWGTKRQIIDDWLIDELTNRYQVPRQAARQWVSSDALLLLLDGLDEVPEAQRGACVDAINDYRGEHGFADIVVCSRIRDYEALDTKLRMNGAILIQPLTDEQIEQYLYAFGTETTVLREMLAHDGQMRELAQSPLMLTIMMLAYRDMSRPIEPQQTKLEDQRDQMFDIYVQRMFNRRAETQSYTPDETRHYLSALAMKMSQNGLSLFNIEDIQPIWLDTAQEVTRFPTLIRLVCMLSMGITWLIGGLLLHWFVPGGLSVLGVIGIAATGALYGFLYTHPWVTDSRYNGLLAPLAIGLALSGSIFLGILPLHEPGNALLLSIAWVFAASFAIRLHISWIRRWRTQPSVIMLVERLNFSWNAIQWRKAVLTCLFTLPVSLLTTLSFFPKMVTLTPGSIGIALASGLLWGIGVTYFDGFVSSPITNRLRPNDGIWLSAQTMVRFTLLQIPLGVVVGMGMIGLGVLPQYALLFFVAYLFLFGTDTLFSHSGISVLQHLILRFQLEQKKLIPRNYALFLDHAAALVLLRKVGGGYIFVHRYLLEYFASKSGGKGTDAAGDPEISKMRH